ncbi:MAG: formate/nitrite transporter family protein [Candidatus Eremiobacteraeota bacterium]|nr:formate/nitrite transporter family protein [Candidatus Eremiobacteraeota bacterium]MBC5828479.1 formate/nitrite transporter family protein [Candidatus Eremiobacteraeota bacterium]
MAGPTADEADSAIPKEAGDSTVDLSSEEQRKVSDRTMPRPQVVYEVIRQEGEIELSRPTAALAWSGLAAGLSMGFSLVAQGTLVAMLPAAPWRPLISSLGYSIGFIIVILGRQQLFTENTITPILPLLLNFTRARFFNVARLWTVVLLANLAGTFIFALVATGAKVFPADVHAAFVSLGTAAAAPAFLTLFVRGVFAGWLIALMVWVLPNAQQARTMVILIITYVVGVAGLSHVVAGSIDVLAAVLAGNVTWAHFIGGFLLPVFLGNTVGGVALVAGLNHAQVVPEA